MTPRAAVLALLLLPCAARAQEPAPSAAEELTNTLLKKGTLSQEEARPLLDLFAKERQTPKAQFTLMPGATLKVNGLGLFRYTFAQAQEPSTDTNAFAVKAARIKFSGDLPKDFKYSLLLDVARTNGASTAQNSALYDYLLTWAPDPAFNVTAGQFLIPTGAETLYPTDQIDFANRYNGQDRILNPSGRDIGVQASGKVVGGRLYYALGVFNGAGPNAASNDNGDLLYAGRTQWTSKGDFYGLPASLVAGVNGFWKRTKSDPSTLKSSDLAGKAFNDPYNRYVYGGDLALKAGPATLKGEYLSAYLKGRHWDPVIHAHGWYVTGAWRFCEQFEGLVRWQGYDPDDSLTNNLDTEWQTYGVNWFINGQSARITANYTVKNEKAVRVKNDEFILQLQLGF